MTRAQKLNITEFPYREYDTKGNTTYYESSSGFWVKYEYNSNGNETYIENSNGEKYGKKRPTKSPLHNTIIVIDGIEYKLKQRK